MNSKVDLEFLQFFAMFLLKTGKFHEIYEKSKMVKNLTQDKNRLEENLSELRLSEESLRSEKENLKLEVFEIAR